MKNTIIIKKVNIKNRIKKHIIILIQKYLIINLLKKTSFSALKCFLGYYSVIAKPNIFKIFILLDFLQNPFYAKIPQ